MTDTAVLTDNRRRTDAPVATRRVVMVGVRTMPFSTMNTTIDNTKGATPEWRPRSSDTPEVDYDLIRKQRIEDAIARNKEANS